MGEKLRKVSKDQWVNSKEIEKSLSFFKKQYLVSGKKNFSIIRSLGGYGDVFCFRPIFSNIKSLFPDSNLVFCTPPAFWGVVVDHPDLDVLLDGSSIVPSFFEEIGFDLSFVCDRQCLKHEIFYKKNVFKPRTDLWNDSMSLPKIKSYDAKVTFSENDVLRGKGVLSRYGILNDLFLIAPVSNQKERTMLFSQVVAGYNWALKNNLSPFLVFSKYMEEYSDFPQIHDISIREYMYLVASSRLVYTVDSFALHLAGLMRVPCVSIFSFTSSKVVPKNYPFNLSAQSHRDNLSGMDCCPCYDMHKGKECYFDVEKKVLKCMASVKESDLIDLLDSALKIDFNSQYECLDRGQSFNCSCEKFDSLHLNNLLSFYKVKKNKPLRVRFVIGGRNRWGLFFLSVLIAKEMLEKADYVFDFFIDLSDFPFFYSVCGGFKYSGGVFEIGSDFDPSDYVASFDFSYLFSSQKSIYQYLREKIGLGNGPQENSIASIWGDRGGSFGEEKCFILSVSSKNPFEDEEIKSIVSSEKNDKTMFEIKDFKMSSEKDLLFIFRKILNCSVLFSDDIDVLMLGFCLGKKLVYGDFAKGNLFFDDSKKTASEKMLDCALISSSSFCYADGIGKMSSSLFYLIKSFWNVLLVGKEEICSIDGLCIPKFILDEISFDAFVSWKSILDKGSFPMAVIDIPSILWNVDRNNFLKYSGMKRKGVRVISFSMFESDKISDEWVFILNEFFSEAWVPDDSIATVYRSCGVNIPIHSVGFPMIGLGEKIKSDFVKKDKKEFVFGLVSSGDYRKSVVETLNAFREAFPEDPNVRFRYHARFYDKEYFEKIQDIAKCDERIVVTKGVVADSIIEEIMGSIDCYVLMSKGEGFSLTPREMMARGVPSIVSMGMAHDTLVKEGAIGVRQAGVVPSEYGMKKVSVGNFILPDFEDFKNKMIDVRKNYDYYLKDVLEKRKNLLKYDVPEYLETIKNLLLK